MLSSHLLRNLTLWIILPLTYNFSIQLDPFHWHLNVLSCLPLKQLNHPISLSQPNLWKDLYMQCPFPHFPLSPPPTTIWLLPITSLKLLPKSLVISMLWKPMDFYWSLFSLTSQQHLCSLFSSSGNPLLLAFMKFSPSGFSLISLDHPSLVTFHPPPLEVSARPSLLSPSLLHRQPHPCHGFNYP